jgi:uncharacterized protein involved in type VI secretion and phage assembly
MPDLMGDWQGSAFEALSGAGSTHFYGKYRGVVVSNDDPASRGRLEVRVPAVLGAEQSVWALPCVPYAGAGVGFYALPEPDTNVWVEFEAGDPSHAIWAGCFWGENELPHSDGAPVKMWKTGKITLRIDDNADEIVIETSSGTKITLAADAVTESGGGKHTVGSAGVVSEKGGKKVEVLEAAVKVNSTGLVVS